MSPIVSVMCFSSRNRTIVFFYHVESRLFMTRIGDETTAALLALTTTAGGGYHVDFEI